jgi:hypothetical protein
MLQEVERDSPVCIQSYDLAVDNGAGRDPFAGAGNVWELSGEEVSSSRPEDDALSISPSKTPVAIEFSPHKAIPCPPKAR